MYAVRLKCTEPWENAESTTFVARHRIDLLKLEDFFRYHPDGSAEIIHIDEKQMIELAHRINTTDVKSVGIEQIAKLAFEIRQKEAELA